MLALLWNCLFAFFVGTLVGLSELLSRDAWKLQNILRSRGGLVYLGLNGIVAIVAYLVALEWSFYAGAQGKSEIWRVLFVSLFSMAVLRSALANIRIGDKEVAAGFAFFLQVFLKRAERTLDQQLALEIMQEISPLVEGLTFSATKNYLSVSSEWALRSLSTQEVKALRDEIVRIDEADVDDSTKMQLLAMRIVERTSVKLFALFADSARKKLVVENKLANEQREDKLLRLQRIKKSLI